MRKASNFKVINIWFSYGIPIGSRRILQFPRYSDYRIQLSEIVGSDIRQDPVGSCRIIWGFLSDPTGSEPGISRPGKPIAEGLK
jgi:hypothetical protein